MNSQKCSICEFVNFADTKVCKRCKRDLYSSKQVRNLGTLSASCPACNSNDTQSFELAYQTGTSVGQAQTTSYNHELGVSIGSVNTSSQTVLASKICPPIKPKNDIFTVGVVVVIATWFFPIYVCANISDSNGKIKVFLFFCILTLIEFFIFWISYKRWKKGINQKQNDYKSAIANWLRSWICLRCGTTWRI